ncbi:hypothetical protein [Massilia sp. BJB1822]|uniref:hypothetical protein n=1 Tax=Massilia sp. BJB1822 TaxID=2744470 RepID=UPI001592FD11|nr:hypothetical protein [Massilia sp. BJB1822]NVD97953.1 hypothetical protein [Massilia sp. BJB1822]
MAQELYAGYQSDYATTMHILLAQFKNIVRVLLKSADVVATKTEDNRITMEVGLSTPDTG